MDEELVRLLDLLDTVAVSGQDETVGTSVRLPVALRDAATIATRAGLVGSTTELTVRGLRAELDALAQRAVLDAHYAAHPDARPDLAEIALATAELDGHPLAQRPDLIRRAVAELAEVVEDPSPDEVLGYAAGLASAA